MPRQIAITDSKKRDAQVAMDSPRSKARHSYINTEGEPVANDRFIKLTEGHDYTALLSKYGSDEAIAEALAEGDPEVDLEFVGRRLGEADRVWVREDGSVLYSARFLQVIYDAEGNETARNDFVDVEATVSDEAPIQWTGRLFPVDEVVRRFALVRKVQLRHINGLTFDFLYEMAKTLAEQEKMLFVAAPGNKPLIFQNNGSPYRGFLEGRVDDDGFLLVLHLSNLELKDLAPRGGK